MLEKIYYNNSIKDWGISLLIIIGAILINNLIFFLIKKRTVKNTQSFIEYFLIALEKPILLGVTLLSIWMASSRLQLGQGVIDLIKKSYDALVVLNITWFFSRFSSALINKYFSNERRKKFKINHRLTPIINRLTLIIIWLTGIVTALTNIGVNTTTLISTLGIGGIAFALASQDTIKNIFGGITIFTDAPFRIGDTVKIDTIEGTVVDIGLRSTRILNYDKRIVTLPNFKVMDSFITNISSEHGRRIVMELGLTYNTPIEKINKAMGILKNLPNSVQGVKEKDLVSSLSNFQESAIVVTLIYFISKNVNIWETRSKVNMEILKSFNENGIEFAFPTRTVYIGGK